MFARSLLSALLLSTLGTIPLHGQAPLVRVTALGGDSIALELDKRSYVVVAEVRPHAVPRILFPDADADWAPLAVGRVILRLVPATGVRRPDSAQPLCIVGPREIGLWSEHGERGRPGHRAACGPLPTNARAGGGTGPWEAWSTPNYDIGITGAGYLAVVVLDGAMLANGLSSAAVDFRQGQSPIDVARRLGGLSHPGPDSWRGAILRMQ